MLSTFVYICKIHNKNRIIPHDQTIKTSVPGKENSHCYEISLTSGQSSISEEWKRLTCEHIIS